MTPVPRAARRHRHLWYLPDGTGLHAPPGRLAVEKGSGRLCCHLCGDWFASLGIHVRVHGHTAGSYRAAMGLPRATVLAFRPARRGDGAGSSQPTAAAGPDPAGQRAGAPKKRGLEQHVNARFDAAPAGLAEVGQSWPEHRSSGWTIIVQATVEGQRRDGDWARWLWQRASAL